MSREYRREYHKDRPKRIIVSAILLGILLVLCIYSLSVNRFSITFMEAWEAVYNKIIGVEPTDYIHRMISHIVIDYNAPRTIIGILVGIILAVSGAVMQTVTRNPLAEPYTIGISSAALFGVTISITLGLSIIPGLTGNTASSVNAFVFAMIPALAIVLISSFKKLSPNMMVLVGIGMMYLFSAVTTFLKFNASEEKLQEIYIWGLGTLSKIDNWDPIIPVLATTILVFGGFMFLSKNINVLMAGDKVCQSLGVNPIRTRLVCFIIVSIGVAVSVCYTGTIGFVGLVAPHIARLYVGNNNKTLIPASAIIGSMMIIIADLIVRSLPGGLPCGVITALIGSPLFLLILYRQRKKSAF